MANLEVAVPGISQLGKASYLVTRREVCEAGPGKLVDKAWPQYEVVGISARLVIRAA